MISVTLPSIYPDALAYALRNIRATASGPVEVIVVSPFPVDGAVWVEDSAFLGCARAHSLGAEAATGEFVVPFADDHEFVPGWDAIAVENFRRRECGLFALGLRGAHSGHVGANWGMYYPYFPMMRLEHVKAVGWIGADYREGFGDSDLAMRVWSAGGRCEWSDIGLLRPTPADKRKIGGSQREAAAYSDGDLRLFTSRWAPGNWPSGSIDDFNIDLRPEENPWAVDGNSIFCPDPSFMVRVRRMA